MSTEYTVSKQMSSLVFKLEEGREVSKHAEKNSKMARHLYITEFMNSVCKAI